MESINLNCGLTVQKSDIVFLDSNSRFVSCDSKIKPKNKKQLREYIIGNSLFILQNTHFVIFKLKTYSISQIYAM